MELLSWFILGISNIQEEADVKLKTVIVSSTTVLKQIAYVQPIPKTKRIKQLIFCQAAHPVL